MGFTNSPLVSFVLLSPNHSGQRTKPIDTITIHCMAGNGTVEACGQLFQSKSRQASSNYGVGSDGRIGMYVEEKNRSWCTSSGANDNRAVTIEVANDGGASTGWHVSDKALNALIDLVTDICKRNNIKRLVWSTNKNTRVQHLNGSNMTIHRDYANKGCPGDYLYSKHGYIAEKVNARLENYETGGLDIDMTENELKEFIEKTVREMGKGEPASSWASEDIKQAKEMGITDGSNPLSYATRQEVMVMTMRATEANK